MKGESEGILPWREHDCQMSPLTDRFCLAGGEDGSLRVHRVHVEGAPFLIRIPIHRNWFRFSPMEVESAQSVERGSTLRASYVSMFRGKSAGVTYHGSSFVAPDEPGKP